MKVILKFGKKEVSKKKFLIVVVLLAIVMFGTAYYTRKKYSDTVKSLPLNTTEERYAFFDFTRDKIRHVLYKKDIEHDMIESRDGVFEGRINKVETEEADDVYLHTIYSTDVYDSSGEASIILNSTISLTEDQILGESKIFEGSMLEDLRKYILGSREPVEDVDEIMRDLVLSGEPGDIKYVELSDEKTERFILTEEGHIIYSIFIQ